MSYTKKQIAAFKDILAWCPVDRCAAVIHQADDKFIVTDGSLCVVLDECPEGFPIDDNGKTFFDFCRMETENGDHELVENSVTVDDCKAAIRQWKEQTRHRTLGTPDQPRIQVNGKVSAKYDARKVLNAMTAIGPKARLYIGRRVKGTSGFTVRLNTLVVANWEVTNSYAVLLPLRVE